MTWIDGLVIGFIVLLFTLLTVFVVFIVVRVIMGEDYAILKKKDEKEDFEAGMEDTALEEPAPAEFYEAKAISKRIYNEFLGIKVAKSRFWFLITFKLENGEEKEIAVPQETFEKVAVGDKGTLVILNGAFFDFGDGEMIEEQEELNT